MAGREQVRAQGQVMLAAEASDGCRCSAGRARRQSGARPSRQAPRASYIRRCKRYGGAPPAGAPSRSRGQVMTQPALRGRPSSSRRRMPPQPADEVHPTHSRIAVRTLYHINCISSPPRPAAAGEVQSASHISMRHGSGRACQRQSRLLLAPHLARWPPGGGGGAGRPMSQSLECCEESGGWGSRVTESYLMF